MSEEASVTLTRQHRRMDAALDALIRGQAGKPSLQDASGWLRLHVWIEEELLFDPIATPALAMPLYIMRYEHAQMWRLLDELATLEFADELRARCGSLRKLMGEHDRKEEDLIYAAVDRLVSANADEALLDDIQNARLPAGWICHGLREDFAPPPGAPPWPPDGRLF